LNPDHRARDLAEERRRRLGEQPLSRILPNMVTLAGLCCGLSAVRWAMLGRWELAAGFIIAAAFIDGMDGRIARMLGATSLFGAQLDSLSDFVCFGVAPVMVIYLWQLHDIRGVGWAIVLFYVVCCALRLARFNTSMIGEKQQHWQKQFFTGVPSPAGGGLCLLPLLLDVQTEGAIRLSPMVVSVYTLLVAFLMVSRIPTFAAKNVRIRHELILPFMALCGFVLVMFVIEPWITLIASGVIYLAVIPLSIRRYHILKARHSPEA